MFLMRLPISFVSFNHQGNGVVALHEGGDKGYPAPGPGRLCWGCGGRWHGRDSGPRYFRGVLGAGECLPCAITFIPSSSSAGKNSSLVMGLFQGDSHGNGEWEAAVSTCVM